MLTAEQVRSNAEAYMQRILPGRERTEGALASEWFILAREDVLTSSRFTMQQMLAHENVSPSTTTLAIPIMPLS